MRIPRIFPPLLFGAFVIMAGMQFAFGSFAKSNAVLGCPVVLSDGALDLTATAAFWQNRSIPPLLAGVDSLSSQDKQVLGVSSGDKWIEVDLKTQTLLAHQGDQIVFQSLISSGLANRTPPGEFRIWYKIKFTKMEGGSHLNNTYYYLPNVPYSMFFNGDYGIHGTYWHSNFGHPMSHGCVNAPTPIAEKLYYWTDPQVPEGKNFVRATPDNPGTRVVIHN